MSLLSRRDLVSCFTGRVDKDSESDYALLPGRDGRCPHILRQCRRQPLALQANSKSQPQPCTTSGFALLQLINKALQVWLWGLSLRESSSAEIAAIA